MALHTNLPIHKVAYDRVAKADYEHDMHLVRELRARVRRSK